MCGTATHPECPETGLGRLRLVAAGILGCETEELLGVREVRAGALRLAELVQHDVGGRQRRGRLASNLGPCVVESAG